jgi:hypothetical protein
MPPDEVSLARAIGGGVEELGGERELTGRYRCMQRARMRRRHDSGDGARLREDVDGTQGRQAVFCIIARAQEHQESTAIQNDGAAGGHTARCCATH